MATTVIVSAMTGLISRQHPTEVYRAYRPPRDSKFRRNWMTMSEVRGKKNKGGLQKAQARIQSLINKLVVKGVGADSGIALIHRLRIQTMVIALFGLNSHFSDFLDEDILLHPGWSRLDKASLPIADKFGDAIASFINGKKIAGDKLFDEADEMFGRFRHALWFATK